MQNPVNVNATKEAKELLNYLSDIAGKGIVSGQHTQTVSMDEISYIKDVTGKEPKLRGFELLAYSPNINYDDADADCLIEVYQNRNTMEEALKWMCASKDATDRILTFSYHWFSPIGGRDKSFYAKNTDFNPEKILEEGTKEREAFYSDMDQMAILLKQFKGAEIPILWRPFHESDGEWFWWGSKGPKVASELYKLMYDHFVNVHHLDNLLWVWNCRLKEGYPGDEYVDIISVDIYLPEYKPTDYAKEYEELIQGTTKNKVAALAEIGYLPDAEMMAKSKVPFAYFMVWSREFCLGEKFNTRKNFKEVYNHPYVVVS